jgi:hypothetical protein
MLFVAENFHQRPTISVPTGSFHHHLELVSFVGPLTMFRSGTVTRCIRPIQRNLRGRWIVPGLQGASFHTSIALHQGHEPHGPPMDDLPKVPIINPADKYKDDVQRLHEYGTYILTCLPKFIQKFRYIPIPSRY